MQSHKDIVRRFYEVIWNEGDESIIPEILCEDFAFRGSLGENQRGREGFSTYIDFIRNALGEYHCEILDMACEGDKVYARIYYTGVHQGELFGYAPTFARIRWEGVAVFNFTEGKISGIWALGDINSVVKQLARYVD